LHASPKYVQTGNASFMAAAILLLGLPGHLLRGGFGVMGWVSASEYVRSQPDPLADSMAEIIQHMNADHTDALVLLARKFAHIESQEATMTAVDRLGFQVRVKTQDGIRGARIAFLREVSNPAETREVLVEMVQQARSEV
jgi:heme iron utilization protein